VSTAESLAPAAPQPLWREAWEQWTRATRAIGVAQTRFLMLLIYLLVVLPSGLLFRLRKDPLHLQPPDDGNWTPSKSEKPTIDRARQQF